MWRWRREGEFGGLEKRQKWLEECWEERQRVGCAGVVRSESYAVDGHGVITAVIHRAVVDNAVLKDFILDVLVICSNLNIRIW